MMLEWREENEAADGTKGDPMKTLGLHDIIGPLMVGPSSSHTAGALAISAMARRLCGSKPKRASFSLYGSFACTGKGHGTDKALVAGMLGMAADDLGIRDSLERAREAGFDVSFTWDEHTRVDHPNTVDIEVEEEGGGVLRVRGESIGGGAAVITRIDGIDVDITGEHTSIVVRQIDERGVLAHIATCLANCGVNIATTRMYRTRKGAAAYTVMETDDAVPESARAAICAHAAVRDVRLIPATTPKEALRPSGAEDPGEAPAPAPGASAASGPASPADADGADAEARFALCDFDSGEALLRICAERSLGIAEAFRQREEALAALKGRPAHVDAYLERVVHVMREAAMRPIEHPSPSMGGLIGGEARAVANAAGAPRVVDPLTADVTAYALGVLETNASMGRIVAAPTAGSAGVVPAVLFGLEKHRGLSEEDLREGLLAAAAVGYLIARNASVSGAEGGCQAEVGSAAAMAAAAAVEMAKGTPEQALDAASNALTCLMGLVCDPVGGLVEVPCQKRNAAAAATALVCAQISLSGIGSFAGFDETVGAMDAVGRALPFELRESALGGIAATPSAHCWCATRSSR